MYESVNKEVFVKHEKAANAHPHSKGVLDSSYVTHVLKYHNFNTLFITYLTVYERNRT